MQAVDQSCSYQLALNPPVRKDDLCDETDERKHACLSHLLHPLTRQPTALLHLLTRQPTALAPVSPAATTWK